jgi:hypothetical protein
MQWFHRDVLLVVVMAAAGCGCAGIASAVNLVDKGASFRVKREISGHNELSPRCARRNDTQSRFTVAMAPASLPQDFLDLADFFLDLAGVLFNIAVSFQFGFAGEFAGNFFDIAFDLMERSFCLISCA